MANAQHENPQADFQLATVAALTPRLKGNIRHRATAAPLLLEPHRAPQRNLAMAIGTFARPILVAIRISMPSASVILSALVSAAASISASTHTNRGCTLRVKALVPQHRCADIGRAGTFGREEDRNFAGILCGQVARSNTRDRNRYFTIAGGARRAGCPDRSARLA